MITLVEQADIAGLKELIEEQDSAINSLRRELNTLKAVQRDHVNQIQYLLNAVKNLEQGKADRGWSSTPMPNAPIVNLPWSVTSSIQTQKKF